MGRFIWKTPGRVVRRSKSLARCPARSEQGGRRTRAASERRERRAGKPSMLLGARLHGQPNRPVLKGIMWTVTGATVRARQCRRRLRGWRAHVGRKFQERVEAA